MINSWKWLCVPLVDNVMGHLEFKAIRGSAVLENVEIDTVHVSKDKCPRKKICL